ncbi:MAG: L,D-transpeptidase family protein [Candidatus Methylacidiphilaceae bacterium]
MRTLRRPRSALAVALCLSALALFFAGSSAWARAKSPHSSKAGAHHRQGPRAARTLVVKVSLDGRAVYVMKGDRPLLVAPTCSGKPGHLTPTGAFHVTGKAKRRRSGRYGFWVKDGQAVEGTKAGGPPDKTTGWRFVGYPMPFWVGFSPGYGFHEGYLWSAPRTHGCLHLSGRDSQRFYELVSRGTLVSIRRTQPEDQTLGKAVHHPEDEKTREAPPSFFLSGDSFTIPWEDALKPAPTGAEQKIGVREPDATTHKEPEPGKSQGSGTAGPPDRPS